VAPDSLLRGSVWRNLNQVGRSLGDLERSFNAGSKYGDITDFTNFRPLGEGLKLGVDLHR